MGGKLDFFGWPFRLWAEDTPGGGRVLHLESIGEVPGPVAEYAEASVRATLKAQLEAAKEMGKWPDIRPEDLPQLKLGHLDEPAY